MNSFQLKAEISASADQVYKDWLNSESHAKFTGGDAKIKAEVGSHFTAWDGYIEGKILELNEGLRILMEWSTSEFPENCEPSIVEVILQNKEGGGCFLTLNHSNIPDNQASNYETGWVVHYFEPMNDYYNAQI